MDAIFKASSGLPHFTRLVFYAIARRADLATGVAGLMSRISLQALREEMYVEPAPGRHVHGDQNRNSIKASLRFLCRNNYLGDRGNFVFEVFCLSQDKSVQNQWTTNGPSRDHFKSVDSPAKTMRSAPVVSLMDRQRTANGPTSEIERDRDIGGSSNTGASTTEQGLTVADISTLFVDQYKFQRHYAFSQASQNRFQQWIDHGIDLEQIKNVVAVVNGRIRDKGGNPPKYPTYYHDEILKVGAGGHEIDQLLG